MNRLAGLRDAVSALSPRRAAILASVVWAVLVGAYALAFLGGASEARGTVLIDGLFFLVSLVLPLILVWLAAFLAEELLRQRDVVAALAEAAAPTIEAMEATRATLQKHGPASPDDLHKAVQGALLGARGPDHGPRIEELVAGQAELYRLMNAIASRPAPTMTVPASPAAEAPAPAAEDASEAPEPEAPEAETPKAEEPAASEPDAVAEAPREVAFGLGWSDLTRALDFPRDGDDAEGFRALKAALRHHSLARMLQAAEDVLNFLSQEGVYMEDATVEAADSDDWRRFIAGERGAGVAGVGAIRDPATLDQVRALMKSDAIFRDTALFFQRRFDVVLHEFGANATDDQLTRLADTRSARAFVLLSRLGGSFD